jgi:CubicO group peptidase (beta-lactamase class C family)
MGHRALVGCLFVSWACSDPPAAISPDAPVDAAPTWQDISPMLEPLRAQHGLPAMTVGVTRGKELIALGAVGVRKLGDPTIVEVDDRWHLGSCTKAMTATLLATFVEQGQLTWDTTLAQAFPTVTIHADYQAVTLEQLLTHWGGAWTTLSTHQAALDLLIANQGPVAQQRAMFTALMLGEAAEIPPGTMYAYSNSGYMVVGAAMERASGLSWEELIRQRVFTPLGMSSCGFGAPGDATSVVEPWGHSVTTGTLRAVFGDNPPAVGPAGTVHCSMEDWGRFLADHSAGDRGQPALLSPASYDRLHRIWPGGGYYALGWGVTSRTWAGGTAYSHSGSNTLWLSTVWLAPAIDMSLFGVVNAVMPGNDVALDTAFSQLITSYGL